MQGLILAIENLFNCENVSISVANEEAVHWGCQVCLTKPAQLLFKNHKEERFQGG